MTRLPLIDELYQRGLMVSPAAVSDKDGRHTAYVDRDQLDEILATVLASGGTFTPVTRLSGVLERNGFEVRLLVEQPDRELVDVFAQALLDHDAAVGQERDLFGEPTVVLPIAGMEQVSSDDWFDQYQLLAVRAEELSHRGTFGGPSEAVSPEAQTLATLLEDTGEDVATWTSCLARAIEHPEFLPVARTLGRDEPRPMRLTGPVTDPPAVDVPGR